MKRWLLVLALVACERTGSNAAPAEGTPQNPVRVCTQEGQSCVHSEGKVGMCTMKMGATGGDGGLAYVCMSLH